MKLTSWIRLILTVVVVAIIWVIFGELEYRHIITTKVSNIICGVSIGLGLAYFLFLLEEQDHWVGKVLTKIKNFF